MTQTVSQALARKWRPCDFDSLVGQEHVVKALSHALDNNRLHHAYLFTGTRGVGKTTIARILARAVNCEMGVGRNPCGKCQACIEIGQGRFVDLLEVDAATNTRVDEMRALLENAMYAPTAGRYKVYVIDEVHMLSTSAFNAMLKTLEEPPAHVLFILATTDPQKIPATVLSRCLQFGLRQLVPDQIVHHLAHILSEENVPFEQGALRLLAKAARGSLRDALSLTDQAIAYSAGMVGEATVRQMLGAVDQDVVAQLLHALSAGDGKALLDISNALAAASAPFASLLDELAATTYRLSIAHFAGGLNLDDPDEAALQAFVGTFGAEDLQLFYQIATHARAELHLAPEESIGFSMALLRMLAFKPGGTQALVLPSGGAIQKTMPANAAPSQALAASVSVPASVPAPAASVSVPASVSAPAASISAPAAVPVTAPAPVTQALPVAASADLPTPDTWAQVSQHIPARGLIRQALVQAQLLGISVQGNAIHLDMRTAIKPYTEASMVSKLEELLSSYYGQTVKIAMKHGEVQQTAHVVQTENRRQAMQEAKVSLDSDPFLSDIQSMMGATVVPGSEKPLEQRGPADI